MRSSLQYVINDFLQPIDAWHEYKFSDRQIQTVAQEFQEFSNEILSNVLQMVKRMERKPSPAKLMSMCRDEVTRTFNERQIEAPEEDPSTWMTSKEYARSQGYESLVDLIKAKIEANGEEMSSGLEKAVGGF